MNDADYEQIKPSIKAATGVDLDFYKPKQMNRRLDSYIDRVAGGSITDFISLIRSDRTAGAALKDFLTINVTEFFRDPHAWEELKKSILPKLLESGHPLKIWSAGCSQGSEPYTLSMILDEIAPRRQHTILATDLDAGVLARARSAGPYAPSELKNFSDGQLTMWFEKQENGDYEVAKHIRKRVTVKQQNLLLDTFDTGFDLIVCRNVVIYFSDAAKRDLNKRFLASLKPGGYFFIGGTETLLDAASIGFERYETSFYRRGMATTNAAKAA